MARKRIPTVPECREVARWPPPHRLQAAAARAGELGGRPARVGLSPASWPQRRGVRLPRPVQWSRASWRRAGPGKANAQYVARLNGLPNRPAWTWSPSGHLRSALASRHSLVRRSGSGARPELGRRAHTTTEFGDSRAGRGSYVDVGGSRGRAARRTRKHHVQRGGTMTSAELERNVADELCWDAKIDNKGDRGLHRGRNCARDRR